MCMAFVELAEFYKYHIKLIKFSLACIEIIEKIERSRHGKSRHVYFLPGNTVLKFDLD